MDGNFNNIDLVMPELMQDLAGIRDSMTTIEQTINLFAECVQRRLNLYCVIVSQINEGRVIFDSVFSSDKVYSENYSKHPPIPQKTSSSQVLSRLISDGKILITTLVSQKDFAPIFMETASSMWLPVKKENRVISIIELGSEKTIPTGSQEDSEVLESFILSYQKLLHRLSQILEEKF